MFLLLLALATLCLGSWPNLFRLSGRTWRFELFSIDFALGAIAASSLIAFFQSFHSELAVPDRLAVAGLRSQAYVLLAGFVFNMGSMLLIGTVSLLGVSRAFLLIAPAACTVAAGASLLQNGAKDHAAWFFFLTMIASVASVEGVRRSERSSTTGQISRKTKSLIIGLLAGLFIGISCPFAGAGLWGELGLHSDAGLLLFSLGVFVSALPFSVYLINVGIEGKRLRLKAYRAGTVQQHGLGWAAGLLWALGTFAALLGKDIHDGGSESYPLYLTLTFVLLPALLTIASGWPSWQSGDTPLPRSSQFWWIGILTCLLAAVAVSLVPLLH